LGNGNSVVHGRFGFGFHVRQVQSAVKSCVWRQKKQKATKQLNTNEEMVLVWIVLHGCIISTMKKQDKY
jgi:hypothetical protein